MPPLSSITDVEMNGDRTPQCHRQMSEGEGTQVTGDRHVPMRSAMDLEVSAFEVEQATSPGCGQPEVNASPAKEEYKRLLAKNLFRGQGSHNRILSFGCAGSSGGSLPSSPSNVTGSGDEVSLRLLYARNRMAGIGTSQRGGRYIPQTPERILDAPDLIDDYYLNLLDWNANNVLAVALGDSVYLWNASTGDITPLMQAQGNGVHITSIAWAPDGTNRMAIGTSDHQVCSTWLGSMLSLPVAPCLDLLALTTAIAHDCSDGRCRSGTQRSVGGSEA